MKSSIPARLSWLHLSDFHLQVKSGWSQDQVLFTMLEDIRARYSGASAPDLLFLTGDIAFSGKAEEYALAEDFVRKLCDAVSLPLERLCLVPGNHDIDLSREEDAVAGARALLTTPLEVDRFFANEGRRKTLFARQMAFRDFANRVLPPSSAVYTASSYAHTRLLLVGSIRVRVLLLDSSWLAGGGPSDAGALLVGERQILDCGSADKACLTFALVHHPFAWLGEFEQVSIENLVMRGSHLCLRGHVHAPDLRATHGAHGRLTTFTAGAAFQNRTASNTYMWCSLDLMTGTGEKIVHRYRHAQHGWEATEKETWVLPSAPSPSADVTATRAALGSTALRYASYVTCLVANLQPEVPVALPNGRVAFVACDATLPGAQNRCGEVIRRLRNHFYWKAVWEAASWETQLRGLTNELAGIFEELEAVVGGELRLRDANSAVLLESFNDGTADTGAACEEIRQLLGQNELERARAVLERWVGQEFLRPEEAHELCRLGIFLLLAENEPTDALVRATTLIQAQDRTPRDIALAGRCAFDAKDHARAATLMHEALDAGVSIEEVRTIARSIAGAAGDKRLAERVR